MTTTNINAAQSIFESHLRISKQIILHLRQFSQHHNFVVSNLRADNNATTQPVQQHDDSECSAQQIRWRRQMRMHMRAKFLR